MSVPIRVASIAYRIQADDTAVVTENREVASGEVTIPATIRSGDKTYPVKAVGQSAFHLNKTITAVKFPADSQVESFDERAFQNTQIRTLEIPSSLTTFHSATFRHTPQLTRVVLKGHRDFEIVDGALYTKGQKKLLFVPRDRQGSFQVPQSVKEIGPYAFDGCTRINKIVFAIENQITTFDSGAFSQTEIVELEIPKTVTRLGEGFVQECPKLVKVTFHPSTKLSEIPPFAFAQTSLENIEIPSSVKHLRPRAFSQTYKLDAVRFAAQSQLTHIHEDVFWSSAVKTLAIPDSVESIAPKNFFSCENLQTITLSASNRYYEFQRDVLWKKGRSQILFGKRTIVSQEIPATVTLIGAHAFCQCRKLKEVTFAANSRLTDIDAYAFFATGLTSIDIPDSVVSIGENAFGNCISLGAVKFGPDSKLSKIGRRAFGLTAITRFDGPSQLSKVGDAVFANSKVQRVSLPERVEELPPLLFFSCKQLEHVYSSNPGKVTANEKAFDDCPSVSIHAKNVDGFTCSRSLNVNADWSDVGAERYEKAPQLVRLIKDLNVNESERVIVDSWQPREGGFAQVFKVRHVVTGEMAAMKVLKTPLNPADRQKLNQEFAREIDVMRSFVHPAILGIIGVIFPSPKSPGKIFTEFMVNDSLNALIKSPDYKDRSPTLKVKIAVGVAAAVRYMHRGERRVVHRDLKPHNVLLDEAFLPRVADFGTARAGAWDGNMTVTGAVGTPYYMAPELLEDEVIADSSIDVFSYSILLWELLTGRLMAVQFPGVTPYAYQTAVVQRHQRPPTSGPGITIQPWVVQLLQKGWARWEGAGTRPTFAEILDTFKANHYQLLPGVDESEVQAYLDEIEDFEEMQG